MKDFTVQTSGDPLHCKSKVEIIGAPGAFCWLLWEKRMGWPGLLVSSTCHKRSLHPPLWVCSFFVYTHTEAGDVRDLWCFLGFVLIKSNPNGDEINLELLGWETQNAGGLC